MKKTNEVNLKGLVETRYSSPETEVVKMESWEILCISGGIDDLDKDFDDESDWV